VPAVMDDPEPALSEVEGLAPKSTARTWATRPRYWISQTFVRHRLHSPDKSGTDGSTPSQFSE
jgi:hypothetical protein